MNASEALEASILHWQENVAAETPFDVKLGLKNCQLCREFPDDSCTGCPVAKFTGESNCDDTPYGNAAYKWIEWKHHAEAKAAWRKAAQAELDFLISLRKPKL